MTAEPTLARPDDARHTQERNAMNPVQSVMSAIASDPNVSLALAKAVAPPTPKYPVPWHGMAVNPSGADILDAEPAKRREWFLEAAKLDMLATMLRSRGVKDGSLYESRYASLETRACDESERRMRGQNINDVFAANREIRIEAHRYWCEAKDAVNRGILALPDLLSACRAALPYIAHFKGGWSGHVHAQMSTDGLCEQLERAIALAEGGSLA